MSRVTLKQIEERIDMANYYLEPLGMLLEYEGSYGTHGLNLVMADDPYGGARDVVRGLTMGGLYEYLGAMLNAFSMIEKPERWRF